MASKCCKKVIFFQAVLTSHFYDGGFYPVGGASEIALNVIPVIERAGGKVLVRANVTEILVMGYLHNPTDVIEIVGSDTRCHTTNPILCVLCRTTSHAVLHKFINMSDCANIP
jgi:phytoene dehydrogenase-like protein